MFEKVKIDAVRANMLLLIGELISQLKIQSVPMIPQVLPLIIGTLKKDDLMERFVSRVYSIHTYLNANSEVASLWWSVCNQPKVVSANNTTIIDHGDQIEAQLFIASVYC